MLRLSINELTTYRWSFDEDVVNFAAHGWNAIGVWRRKLLDYGEQRAIELLTEHSLSVSHVMYAGGFTGNDGRSLRDSLTDAMDAIRLTAALQANCLVVYTGARGGHTHKHVRRLVREALEKLLSVAEEHGVTLALEPMHPECASGWTFLTSLDESLEFLDSLAHPLLKLSLDTYHLGFEPRFCERLAEIAPRTALVHLGDGRPPVDGEQDRCPLGSGELPMREILLALRNAGYDGYLDVLLMGPEIEWTDNDELLAQTRRSFEHFFEMSTSFDRP